MKFERCGLRRVVTPVMIALAVSPITAQGTARIRITAMNTVTLPGQLTVDGARVSGSAIIGMDADVIRVKALEGNAVWTVPRQGTRLTGIARGGDGSVLELLREGDTSSMFVPLAVIHAVEISHGRRKNHGILLGILAGVGAFYGVAGLAFSQCGLACSDGWIGVAGAAGLLTGGAVAHHLRRERWETVPVAALLTELSRRNP